MDNVNTLSLDRAFAIPKEQILGHLRVKITDGLTSQEVESRLTEYGPNEVEEEEEGSLLMDFLEQFTEPLVLLLLGSAAISLFLKQYDDAISILLAVTIVSTVAFVQGYKSDQAVAALQSYVQRKCTVLRNFGHLEVIGIEQLVPGDVVKLEIGNIVPADIRLIETSDLRIQEAIFTGEPKARNKNSKVIIQKLSSIDAMDDLNHVDEATQNEFATLLSERRNMAFMGTKVSNGTALGIVVATGRHTQLSKIAQRLKETESKQTPLQEKMDELGKHLSFLSFIIITVIFIIGALKGHPWIEMFNVGVSLAVAAIPEGLPIVVTVTLALGVQRMSKKNAIVRRLPAVEALGSASVCCVDKTGTLTQNEMTATHFWSPTSKTSSSGSNGQFYSISGVGYGNVGTITANNQPISTFTQKSAPDLLIAAQISAFCNNATIHRTGPSHAQVSELLGQPTEGALLAFAEKCSVQRESVTRTSEIPFNSVQKWMAVQCNNPDKPSSRRWYVKGALEWVLENSTRFFDCSSSKGFSTITDTQRESIRVAYSHLTNQALRCVALAYSDDPQFSQKANGSTTSSSSTDDLDALKSISQREHHTENLSLVFCGIVGIIDPPRPFVKDSVKLAMQAHIQICMITGDAQPTAEVIAHQLGFFDKSLGDRSMNASQVELWAKRGLLHEQPLERIKVFYRASPFHKSEIVKAFQKRGHVVAMTGDGVNDAISLKLADIGIAMGDSADVTKEVAEMILVDNNFSTIIAAIEEGKCIFNNIGSFLEFQLTTSIAALSIIALATIFGIPLPLSTTMILFINIVMDGPPAQSLGVGNRTLDHAEMKKPPRPRNAPILTNTLLYRTILNAMVMVVGTLFIFHQYLTHFGTVHPSVNPGHSDEILDVGVADDSLAITVTFATFVMFQMFNAHNCRSPHKSVFSVGLFTNFPLFLSLAGCIIALLAIIYVPYLQFIFNTTALTMWDWKNVLITSSSIFFTAELRKVLKIFNT